MRSRILLVLAASGALIGCGDEIDVSGAIGGASFSEGRCEIVFGVTNDVAFANMDGAVDYRAARGRFLETNPQTECRRLLRGVSFGIHNHCVGDACPADDRRLTFSIAAGNETIQGPVNLFSCMFEADGPPRADAFQVEVVDAVDVELAVVRPRPRVAVTSIRCDDRVSTTSTSTTTTTIEACEGVSCRDGEHCEAGICTAGGLFTLEASLVDPVTLGAIQVDVFYDCALGDVVGNGATTLCRAEPTLPASPAFNDRPPEKGGCQPLGRLLAGLYSLNGMVGPTPLFTCVFTAAAGVKPSVDDFSVTLVDATTPDLRPVDVRVVISKVERATARARQD